MWLCMDRVSGYGNVGLLALNYLARLRSDSDYHPYTIFRSDTHSGICILPSYTYNYNMVSTESVVTNSSNITNAALTEVIVLD